MAANLMEHICTITRCSKKHYARGLCAMHYQRNRDHGTTDGHPRHRAFPWLLEATKRETDECIDWPFGTNHGYGVMRINGKAVGAHRVACTLVHGDPPVGRDTTAHSCGRPVCVNPRHLRWATVAENQSDRVVHGTSNRGSRHGLHKLTEADVIEIRQADAGTSQAELAIRFGVSRVTISNVITRTSWAWLDQVAA